MSLLKIEDVAYVRFRAPDLAEMRAFLEDFGLVVSEAAPTRLVARAAGPSPVAHVTELGEAGFAGVAFRAESVADLERLAAAEGVAVEAVDLPGGGEGPEVDLRQEVGVHVDPPAGAAAAVIAFGHGRSRPQPSFLTIGSSNFVPDDASTHLRPATGRFKI